MIALAALPLDALAIPAFARKYRVSCSMCHQPAPRLTPFGAAFAGNGFEMAVGEEPRDTVSTGDPLLRLTNGLPLAVRFEAYQRILSDRKPGEAILDQQTPWIIKVLSGGQVADKISYYMYFLATAQRQPDRRGVGVCSVAQRGQAVGPLGQGRPAAAMRPGVFVPPTLRQPVRYHLGDVVHLHRLIA
ncbi:MAG: hypothetical protein C0497_13095 [Gemmatimonas sp.]|nr:hypothetical protein [Gemmatimonas sp.]